MSSGYILIYISEMYRKMHATLFKYIQIKENIYIKSLTHLMLSLMKNSPWQPISFFISGKWCN